MTAPIFLSLVFHNHQPIGQFDYVTEHATHVSYLPLIEALERFRHVKVAMHFSGALLDWVQHHQHDLIERLRALVTRGQVELLSGGYYEPALIAIPDEDKIGQIEKLNTTLLNMFGTPPEGLWLAERIWEPHLARPIAQAAIKYAILDDTHFERVGFDKERDLFGYYMTEEQGASLAVFPSLTYLRYAIPYAPVETLFDWLRANAITPEGGRPPRLAMMADDSAKFGMFPGTYEYCWGDGKYIEELFTSFEMNREWLRTITPGEYRRTFAPLGRAYLPAESYMEMGVWSLLPDDSARLGDVRRRLERERRPEVIRFLGGGLWRNFMVKYEEINHLHKRMLLVSKKVHAMRRGRKRDRALELLWASQGNDPYWHGLYGGAYLFNIRVANYTNIIAAEEAAESEELMIALDQRDFDTDGHEELIITSQGLNAICAPAQGGAILELDYRPAHYNLYNVMTRRKEGYHSVLEQAAAEGKVITPDSPNYQDTLPPDAVRSKEPGLEKRLVYDWHRRTGYIDHFLGATTTFSEFARATYAEQGDFVNQPYKLAEVQRDDTSVYVALERDGHVWIGEIHRPVRIRKSFVIQFNDPTLYVKYTITQGSESPIFLRFGMETVIGFDDGHDLRYCALHVNEDGERRSLALPSEFEGVNAHTTDSNLKNLTVRTELSRPAFLWSFPLETITCSESGFESTYQGTVFLHLWHIHLNPGERWEVNVTQTVQQTATRPGV
ncbi:MAG TPA: DUF1926 domain-containing protein [Aggregatilineales bacterium]|nr:DUF1926 domain-containing protein [Anaerolineales bacterium]HRE48940.1 DUF1926 domain-containing protein [Aggregatilineales bacterium]